LIALFRELFERALPHQVLQFVLDAISNFFNEVTQPFLPGRMVHFQVNSTNIAPPAGGFPDELAFLLLDTG